MKKIISFIIAIILFCIFIKVNAEEYESFKSGDLVRYNDIAFYVLYDSDSTKDSVQLLKAVPLTHNEINKYTDNKANLYVLYNNNWEYRESDEKYAYGNMAFYYGDGCYYKSGNSDNSWFNSVTSGCLSDYELSNVKKVVDAWTSENTNDSDIVIFEDGYKSRLLNINEIAYFDSNIDTSSNFSEYSIDDIPQWLNRINHDGWTMTENKHCTYYYGGVVNTCTNNVYVMHSDRYSSGSGHYELISSGANTNGSVRPTIKLKKSSIEKIEFNEYHDNRVREYKIGDIINYNDTKFYVIKDSSESDSTVTLLKDKPLTKYELETYGEGYINNYIYQYNWKNVTPGKVIFDNGLNKVAYLSTDKCYYNSSNNTSNYSGCSQNYDLSNVKHIVDNWLLGTINISDMTEDENGYSSRLIDSDDLVDLGYINIQANTAGKDNFKVGNDTPEFMLNENTKGMLTMIPSYLYTGNGYNDYGIAIADDGYSFITRGIPNVAIGTVRPVVTLNKKEIAKKITNVEEDEETDNIEVIIETKVDNDNIDNKTVVSVPNTFLRKGIIIVLVGIILAILSMGIIVYVKKKK